MMTDEQNQMLIEGVWAIRDEIKTLRSVLSTLVNVLGDAAADEAEFRDRGKLN